MERVETFLKDKGYLTYKLNEPLKNHSTMRVGGTAALLFIPENKQQIVDCIQFCFRENIPYKIIGNGSNTLFSDDHFEGVIIKNTKALKYLIIDGCKVTVGSSYPLVKLAYDLTKSGLTGMEFAGGIPGTIGGALFMNAGAYNKEMKDVVKEVSFLDVNGQVTTLQPEDLHFSYRKSIFKELKEVFILEVVIDVEIGEEEEMKALLQKRKQRRLDSQPLNYPSCGSTFKNPTNLHAYQLIDGVGLRGYSIGGAKFSEKHCNFIINYNDALASDVKSLIDLAQTKVYEHYKITLIPEIELFNWEK